MIPEDWEVTSIGEVAFVTKLAGFEYTKHFDYRQTGPIIAIKALNIKNGMLDLIEVQTIPLETSKSLPRSQLAKGDLVISYVGALLGQVAVIPEDNKFHLAPNVAKIRINPKHLNQLFLSQYLNGKQGQSAIYESIASSGQPALSMRTLREITIIFPPLPEQRAIATVLSDVDALINSLDKLITKKHDIKQATMQQLLTGKTRLPGFHKGQQQTYKQTEIGMILEDWGVYSLGDIVTKVGSGITPKGGEKVYKKEGRPFLRSQNVGWGHLLLDDVVFIDEETHSSFSATEIKQNDVLLNITGASIGRSAVVNNRVLGGNVNQHVCIIRIDASKLSSYYLNFFLLSKIGQMQIDSFQAGGNRQGLNFGQIKSFQIPLPEQRGIPSLPEQRAIATVLSDMDAEIAALEHRREKTRMLKQGMMQELLTGKTRLV